MSQYESPEEFEKALADHLQSRNIGKNELSAISRHLVDTYKSGIEIFDWHQIGIPYPDGIMVKGVVRTSNSEVLTRLFKQHWREILVLKRGTPLPDFFEVNINIQTERFNQ